MSKMSGSIIHETPHARMSRVKFDQRIQLSMLHKHYLTLQPQLIPCAYGYVVAARRPSC
jgi:hypothetical protein